MLAVPRNDGERSGDSAAGGRNTGQRRQGKRGGYARDNFHVNAMSNQEFPLFGSASKDHGIAALQADHVQALRGVMEDPVVDVVLDSFLLALLFAAVH